MSTIATSNAHNWLSVSPFDTEFECVECEAETFDPETDATVCTVFKLSDLTAAIVARGIPAVFAMSGGNCGTIYVGEIDADGHGVLACGPGTYSADWATTDEFYIGRDDQGVNDDLNYDAVRGDTVESLADVVAAAYAKATA